MPSPLAWRCRSLQRSLWVGTILAVRAERLSAGWGVSA